MFFNAFRKKIFNALRKKGKRKQKRQKTEIKTPKNTKKNPLKNFNFQSFSSKKILKNKINFEKIRFFVIKRLLSSSIIRHKNLHIISDYALIGAHFFSARFCPNYVERRFCPDFCAYFSNMGRNVVYVGCTYLIMQIFLLILDKICI